jgi:crotonobetainyl-CoA:carnitine CoA-transferase CaiB-like acyl-CoA transferase
MPTADDIPFVPDGSAAGVLDRVRVVELADERAEYVGLLLERSLFFALHNRAKQSVAVDLGNPRQLSRVHRRSTALARGLWWCM